MTPSAEAALRSAMALHQAGDFEQAEWFYQSALKLQPNLFEALHYFGLLEAQRGRHENALRLLTRSIRVRPRAAEAHANLGTLLRDMGRYPESLASFEKARSLEPGSPEILYNHGVTLHAMKDFVPALACFEETLAAAPRHLGAWNGRGSCLHGLGRDEEAVAAYDQALAIEPADAEVLNNRGNALDELHRPAEALACYEAALAVRPDYAEALANRGVALKNLGRPLDALASYDRALVINPGHAMALSNRAELLAMLGRLDEAAESLAALLMIDPQHDYAVGKRVQVNSRLCDWRFDARDAERLVEQVRAGVRAIDPLSFLALTDSAADQLTCARTWVKAKCRAAAQPLWRGEAYGHERIRIAYLSPDFRLHAVMRSMVRLFETHDRTRFETVALSFGPDEPSAMRLRLERAFEHFLEVRHRSNREIAVLMREREIDIAVDLAGFTQDARPGILALRPAPVQVNYLGFPGTLGAPWIDYLVADSFVVPEAGEPHYSERIVRLPETFQANDPDRPAAAHRFTRAEVGLPERGFVFCAFSNSYRITPAMFGVWMELLRGVEGSVLWLLQDNETVGTNLLREAEARNVARERLVFAPRLPYAEYLERYRLADLFLDTLPFNAGTTASDALWAGLPVLTCAGEAFAARMAGSLLRAAGLPDLVTQSLEQYKSLALRLAREPQYLADVKARLARSPASGPLFDADRFRRHLESAYVAMWERAERGEVPTSFDVPRLSGNLSAGKR